MQGSKFVCPTDKMLIRAGINEENVEPNRFWNYTDSDSES